MHTIVTLLTNDPHLGRVNYASLSDQTLMEMLVESFCDEAKKQYQHEPGVFLDICKWPWVSFDDAQNVTIVQGFNGDGSISLEFIPPKTQTFLFSYAKLTGTLETSALAQHMTNFMITGNNFHGIVDFTTLPETMQILCLEKNNFTGSAVFDRLPRALRTLNIHENRFSGGLNLKSLLPSLESLNASSNAFCGAFHIENMSEDSAKSCFIDVSRNQFDEVAIVPAVMRGVRLQDCGVITVVDAEGDAHPDRDTILKPYQYQHMEPEDNGSE